MQPTCIVCGARIPLSKVRATTQFCSNKCRQKAYRNRHPQTNGKPKAPLSAQQPRALIRNENSEGYLGTPPAVTLDHKTDWHRAQRLAERYCTPSEWIERAITACRRAGVDPDYVERRYLRNDGTELNLDVDREMPQVLRETRT
jgi:hypothetical protein